MTTKTSADKPVNGPHAGPKMREQLITITDLLAYRLHRVANLVSRSASMRYKRQFNVSLWEWRAIAFLGAKQTLSLNDLAKAGDIDKGQVSLVVMGLVDRRLVQRKVDENDARKIQLSLTASGRRLYKELIHASDERNSAFLDCVTLEERQALDSVLAKLECKAHEYLQKEKDANK